MTDLLRAWNILTPEERPEGMSLYVGIWHDLLAVTSGNVVVSLSPAAAYDRLCQAVEGVLYAKGYRLTRRTKDWIWSRHNHEPAHVGPDRLTVAVLALEAERGAK